MKSLIKCVFLIQIWIIFPALSVQAGSMYVTDILKVTLRTGPSIDNKIIKIIESGQKVEVVESGQEWSLVRIFDGQEGWILNRYLIPNETDKLKLERLQSEHSNLKAKFRTTFEEKVEKLTFSNYISWFLAGSGVLFVGFILGFSTKRQRRQSSLL